MPITKKVKKGRKSVAASSAAVLVRKNADKTAQPGIIASIIEALDAAKKTKSMLTVDEIVEKLHKQFPNRPITGMATTVRAQLSRLPSEKEFKIKKLRDGRHVRYAAA